MLNEIIAIPTELTDAELDAVGGGAPGDQRGLVNVEVRNVLNNLSIERNQIGAAIAGFVRQNQD